MILYFAIFVSFCFCDSHYGKFNTIIGGYYDYGYDVLEVEDGYLVGGQAENTPECGFVTKFDRSGKKVWMKEISSNSYASIHGIFESDNENFIAFGYGRYGNDFASVYKFTTEGNLVDSKLYSFNGGTSDKFYGVSETTDGGFIAVGTSGSPSDILTVKMDQDGNITWSRTYTIDTDSGNINWVGVDHVVELSDGYLVVGDVYWNGEIYRLVFVKYDFDGNFVSVKSYNDLIQVAGCNKPIILVPGTDDVIVTANHIDRDKIIVFRLNAALDITWSKTFTILGYAYSTGAQLTSEEDGFYITGGTNEGLLVKMFFNGSLDWVRKFDNGGGGDATLYSIISILPLSDGDFFISGTTYVEEGDAGYPIMNLLLDGETFTTCMQDIILQETYVFSDTVISPFSLAGTAGLAAFSKEDLVISWDDFTPDSYFHQCYECKSPYEGDTCGTCPEYYHGSECSIYECASGKFFSNETMCNGEGTCDPGDLKCSCNDSYVDDFCEVYICAGFLSNQTMCSGEGTCTTVGGEKCDCNDYFVDDFCAVYECGGYFSNETMCNGEGSCVVPGEEKCNCNDYYVDEFCSVYKCAGFLSNETMCNGEGSCLAGEEKCSCNDYYVDDFCAVYECAGFLSNETKCNGVGTCEIVGGKSCFCNDYYYGDECEVYECAGFFSNQTESEICNGRGNCEVPGDEACVCTETFGDEEKLFQGSSCDLYECLSYPGEFGDGSSFCNDNGNCQPGEICDCEDGYIGDKCETEVENDDDDSISGTSALFVCRTVIIFLLYIF